MVLNIYSLNQATTKEQLEVVQTYLFINDDQICSVCDFSVICNFYVVDLIKNISVSAVIFTVNVFSN